MKNILLFGAGRSSTYLIQYLLSYSVDENWKLTIADTNLQSALDKLNNHSNGNAIACDIENEEQRRALISNADIVISMLPAFMHMKVAIDCIDLNKDLATASYLSAEMKALDSEIKAKGLVFGNELGLDPGLDHMSAMEMIHDLKAQGAEIKSFKSYTGGLVAKESDDNPWNYKISWNPRNVVLAGQGTAQYLKDGKTVYTPYQRIYKNAEVVDIKGYGPYSMYVNRDSISYIQKYELPSVKTMIRGTLRTIPYTQGWSIIVALGMTDDTTQLSLQPNFKIKDFTLSFLNQAFSITKETISQSLGYEIDDSTYDMLSWLGLFSDTEIPLLHPTPAQVIEYIIVNKWKLSPYDKDLVVMQHEIEYKLDGNEFTRYSTLYREGNDAVNTAMAELVGLPLAIFVKLRLQGKINTPGTIVPVTPSIYEPILSELKSMGIAFSETVIKK